VAADGAIGLRHKQGVTELALFDTVPPLRENPLVSSILAAIAVISPAGWLLMGLAASLHVTVIGGWNASHELAERLHNLVRPIPAYGYGLALLGPVVSFLASSSFWLAFSLRCPLHPSLLAGGAVWHSSMAACCCRT
jgi:hypothetical protein